MKNGLLVLSMLTLFMALHGCGASSGSRQIKDETQQSVSTKITKGTTTKQEVSAMFGSPTKTTFTDSGNEIWHYIFIRATPKAINFVPVANAFSSGNNIDRKELAIFFGKTGIVENYSMQNAKEDFTYGAGN